jgi:triacylglycerol lipase
MIKYIILYFLSFIMLSSTSMASAPDCVLLLHGLARTHHAMSSLESTLKQHDYLVVNRDYPSTKQSIETLAEYHIQPMIDACLIQQPEHIIVITHSLGGLVFEKYLETHALPELSHVVMLSPPHHGSPLANMLHHHFLYQTIMGPAGEELLTTDINNTSSIPKHVKFGIIAGNFNLVPFSHAVFHEENDGKVSVSSAKADNMTDFIVLPVSHTFMMNNHLTQRMILNFLQHGVFRRTI